MQRKAFKTFNVKLKKRIESIGTGDRNFWKLIKDISGLEDTKSFSAPAAEDIANHFASKMTSGKDTQDDHFQPGDIRSIPLSSFKIRFKRVLKILKSLDTSKSINGAGPLFLRECAEEIAPLLYKLFKFIVKRAQYPANWKLARVTPVHKRGAVSLPANYRPVSVLDNIESAFEDVVKPQFEGWILHFIPDWQYGFVSGHGTDDYGADLSFTIQKCLEARKEGILIATDIKGAFDRCWWKRLVNRLRKRGLRRKALKLFRNYLHLRFIQVVMSGKSSSNI